MHEYAKQLNDHLAAGGLIQVATRYRATVYDRRHAGWFTTDGHSLFVRRGRQRDTLAYLDPQGRRFMHVKILFGRLVDVA